MCWFKIKLQRNWNGYCLSAYNLRVYHEWCLKYIIYYSWSEILIPQSHTSTFGEFYINFEERPCKISNPNTKATFAKEREKTLFIITSILPKYRFFKKVCQIWGLNQKMEISIITSTHVNQLFFKTLGIL